MSQNTMKIKIKTKMNKIASVFMKMFTIKKTVQVKIKENLK